MPNPEHMALLLSDEWNAWRARNVNVTPDLTEAALSGQDLSGKDLKRADLSRAELQGANLAAADLSRAVLIEAKVNGASGPGTIFENCVPGLPRFLPGLSPARASGRHRSRAARFYGANLAGADLSRTHCDGPISRRRNSPARTSPTSASAGSRRRALTSTAPIFHAPCSRESTSPGVLPNANFSGANLKSADLTGPTCGGPSYQGRCARRR